MASGENDVKIVDAADLADSGPMVRVESVEKSSFFSFLGLGGRKTDSTDEGVQQKNDPDHAPSSEKKEEPAHKKAVVHEGDDIKTTYDVEEDVPPSLVEQMKRKIHWNGR